MKNKKKYFKCSQAVTSLLFTHNLSSLALSAKSHSLSKKLFVNTLSVSPTTQNRRYTFPKIKNKFKHEF